MTRWMEDHMHPIIRCYIRYKGRAYLDREYVQFLYAWTLRSGLPLVDRKENNRNPSSSTSSLTSVIWFTQFCDWKLYRSPGYVRTTDNSFCPIHSQVRRSRDGHSRPFRQFGFGTPVYIRTPLGKPLRTHYDWSRTLLR